MVWVVDLQNSFGRWEKCEFWRMEKNRQGGGRSRCLRILPIIFFGLLDDAFHGVQIDHLKRWELGAYNLPFCFFGFLELGVFLEVEVEVLFSGSSLHCQRRERG